MGKEILSNIKYLSYHKNFKHITILNTLGYTWVYLITPYFLISVSDVVGFDKTILAMSLSKIIGIIITSLILSNKINTTNITKTYILLKIYNIFTFILIFTGVQTKNSMMTMIGFALYTALTDLYMTIQKTYNLGTYNNNNRLRILTYTFQITNIILIIMSLTSSIVYKIGGIPLVYMLTITIMIVEAIYLVSTKVTVTTHPISKTELKHYIQSNKMNILILLLFGITIPNTSLLRPFILQQLGRENLGTLFAILGIITLLTIEPITKFITKDKHKNPLIALIATIILYVTILKNIDPKISLITLPIIMTTLIQTKNLYLHNTMKSSNRTYTILLIEGLIFSASRLIVSIIKTFGTITIYSFTKFTILTIIMTILIILIQNKN